MDGLRRAHTHSTQAQVEVLMGSYGFIGLAEMLDESFVVLAHILQIELADVLFLDAKTPGTKDFFCVGRNCSTMTFSGHPKFEDEPDEVQAHVKGPFAVRNERDYLLYDAVRERLHQHTQTIPHFDQQLTTYKSMRQKANALCGNFTRIYSGECYWKDNGCGYKCMDTLESRAESSHI